MKMKEFFVLLVLAASLGYIWIVIQPKKNELVTITPPGAEPSKVVSKNNPNLKTYNSKSFGLSFDYDVKSPQDPNYGFGVEEKDKKIYVYAGNIDKDGVVKKDLTGAQYVEVFTKDPKDTLQAAIQKKFLKKYAEKDCYPQAISKDKIPANYELAIIAFPKSTNNDGPWWQNADKCPKIYTETNGAAYFMMDKNHPDKFLFLNIGQYGIPAGDKNWQDTIRFN